MSAVAVNVNSADCKTAGCAGEAAWARGPYAGLCTSCAAVAKRRLSASVADAAAKMTPEQRSWRSAKGNQGRRKAESPAASRVRSVLRDVEAAVVELDKARAAELAAAETYRDARQRRTVAEEKVAAVRAALDAAIAGTGETTDA